MALTESSRLFYWDARYDPLRAVRGPDATFARNGAAWEWDGTLWRKRIINQPRVEPSVNIDGFPASHVRIEQPTTGQMNDPGGSFAAGGEWSHSNISGSAGAVALIEGGSPRALSTGGAGSVFQQRGTLSGNKEIVDAIVEPTGTPSSLFGIRDSTASTWVYLFSVDWATGVVATVSGTGFAAARLLSSLGPNGGPVWKVDGIATGTSGNNRVGYFWVRDQNGVNAGSAVLHYCNVFTPGLAVPCSPVIGDAGVTQPAELLSFPTKWNRVPHAGVVEIVNGHIDGPSASSYFFAIGGSTATTDPRFLIFREGIAASEKWRVFDDDGTTTRNINLFRTSGPGKVARIYWRSAAARLDAFVEETDGLNQASDVTALNYTPNWPTPRTITLGAASPAGALAGNVGMQRAFVVAEADLGGVNLDQDARDELAGYYLDPHGRLIS